MEEIRDEKSLIYVVVVVVVVVWARVGWRVLGFCCCRFCAINSRKNLRIDVWFLLGSPLTFSPIDVFVVVVVILGVVVVVVVVMIWI